MIGIFSIVLGCQGIPEIAAKVHYERGEQLADEGDFNQAIAEFNLARKDDNVKVLAYSGMVRAYYNQGDYDQALKICDEALKRQPENYYIYNLKARIYLVRGDLDTAMELCKASMDIFKVNSSAYAIRAMIYYEMQDYPKVLEDCQTAMRLNPNDALAYNVRGRLEMKAAQADIRELDKAIADYTRSIELQPGDPKIYWNRAIAYSQKGDLASAAADLRMIISLTRDPELVRKAELFLEEINAP